MSTVRVNALNEVLPEKLILKLETELNKPGLTAHEATGKIEYLINSYRFKNFSGFVVDLLRETRSSTYELKELSIEDANL